MIKSFGMKKLLLLSLFMLFAGAMNAQVAVMDFDNEAGLSTKEMAHLADTLADDIAEQFSNLIIIKEDEHHLNNDTIPDFRKKGLCFFPEIGFSCPLPEDFDIAPFGPIIILGMGYQFNPHWLLGISAGYGGNVRDYKTFRIGSDIRFYCAKRKNSLFLDFGTGYATEYNGVYFSLSIGYAIKRLEIDTKLYFDGCASASIDFRYRFNFKR